MANTNVPSFPYAAPTDAVLTVASDNAETTLAGNITSGSTSIVVTSASGFNVPCLIVIDGEIILAQSKASNTFNDCIRGFSDTTPASHTTGANVYGYILAHHHNQLAAEIKTVSEYLINDFSGFKTTENLTTYSEDFSQGYWGKSSGVAILTDTDELPNGSVCKIIKEGTSSGLNMISATPENLVDGNLYTFSVYAKYDSVQWMQIGQHIGGPEHRWAWFDVQNGVVGTVGALAQASIVPVGNGWYRLLVVTECTSNVYKAFDIVLVPSDGASTYLGTGTDFNKICGAQVRSGGFNGPLTYIKTAGAAFSLVGSGDLILDAGDLS